MNNELAVIKNLELVPFFTKSAGVDDTLEQIAKEARSHVPDVSTSKGRNAIKANVTLVQKSKTYLEKNGKELAAEYKAIPKQIDATRRKTNDFLNDLQKEVRLQLTEWEAEQVKIEAEKVELARIAVIDADWDFAQMMMKEYFSLIAQGDFEVAHMKKVASEKAEQDRISREKKIAEDAATAAKLKAEQEAAVEKQRLIDVAKQLEVNAENQRKAAMQAERDAEIAEQERAEAVEKAKQDAIEATVLLKKQEADNELKRIEKEKENTRLADEAKALAETSRLAAIEQTKRDEAKKIADKKLIDDQETATRKANVAHATSIKKAIISALMEHAKLSKEDATATASALWYGKITNINVTI